MLEAVIFDWAGTTVDYGSFSPIYAFEKTFQAYGLNPTMEEIRRPMGMLKIDHIRAMLKMERLEKAWRQAHGRGPDEADVNRLYEVFQQEIFKVLSAHSELKPEVNETVRQLRERGLKIGSTTGYTKAMMEIVVHKAAEQGYTPDYWAAPDMVGLKGRPYPYMIFRNLEALGVSCVHSAVKVGDTVSDITEGRNAGLRTIGVLEGSSVMGMRQADFEGLPHEAQEAKRQAARKVYEAAGADYTVCHLGELPALLTEIEKERF